MPTTRGQRSRPQTRLDTRKQTKKARKRANLHTSKSCTRSGREFRSLEDDISGRRSTRTTARITKATHAQELRQRIASIPMKGRHVPDTDNLKVLGAELKLRLAANCDIISEHGRRGGKVNVMTVYSRHRFVPMWDIDRHQDPSLLCEVKVKVKPPRLRINM